MAIIISPSVYLEASDAEAFNYGHIGYSSFVTEASLSATSSNTSFPVTSLANPLTTERWKPLVLPVTISISLTQARTINYVGLAGHTFGSRDCSISLQYSVDSGATWIEVADASPINNRPIMFLFASVFARDWQIVISGTQTIMPSLAVLYMGTTLRLERKIYGGHTPITLGRKTRVIRNETEGGQFAGSSIITEGVNTSIALKNLTASWYRDKFDKFVVATRGKPFFFAWRYLSFPDEVGFVWVTNDVRPSNMGVRDFMQVEFEVSGYSDE